MRNQGAKSGLSKVMNVFKVPFVAVVCATLVACSQEGPGVVATQPPPPPTPGPSATAVGTPVVTAKDVVAKGLRAPWSIAFLPDGSALVTERDSRRVLKVAKGAGHDAPYAVSEVGVIQEADPGGEGGLLGIAVSPGYAQDQTIFLYYTIDNDNRVAKWQIGGRPQPILTGIPVAGNHNGGRLAFGPDKMLYVTTGDAARTATSQDQNSLAGKILRMTPDGKPAPGNPFNNYTWTFGHRNVQGISWDSSGRMWASEFGQNTWDEINLIEKGKNYGWPEVEGAAGDKRFTDPVAAFPTSDSSCSGTAVAGDILAVACLRGQRLILVHVPPGGVSQPNMQVVKEFGRLRDAVMAPDKSLWVLTNNHDGRCNAGCTKHPDDDRILRITVGT
jgi:glucose/arabinose dehydrogenase